MDCDHQRRRSAASLQYDRWSGWRGLEPRLSFASRAEQRRPSANASSECGCNAHASPRVTDRRQGVGAAIRSTKSLRQFGRHGRHLTGKAVEKAVRRASWDAEEGAVVLPSGSSAQNPIADLFGRRLGPNSIRPPLQLEEVRRVSAPRVGARVRRRPASRCSTYGARPLVDSSGLRRMRTLLIRYSLQRASPSNGGFESKHSPGLWRGNRNGSPPSFEC